MAEAAPRIYLCSTEWIALLTGEDGAEGVRGLIERANAGAFSIIGSELLRMEVLLSGSEDLLDGSVRIWAAMDRKIATRARSLRLDGRQVGKAPQCPDAIHVATAVEAGVDAFITSDSKCRSLAEQSGLKAFDRGQYPEGEIFSKVPDGLSGDEVNS